MKEYQVWGVPAGQDDETLLVARYEGKFITDRKIAEKLAAVCRDKFGATAVRIGETNMDTPPDFTKTIAK